MGQSSDIDFSSPVPVDTETRDSELYKRWLEGTSAAGYYSEPFQMRFKEGNTVINLGLTSDT